MDINTVSGFSSIKNSPDGNISELLKLLKLKLKRSHAPTSPKLASACSPDPCPHPDPLPHTSHSQMTSKFCPPNPSNPLHSLWDPPSCPPAYMRAPSPRPGHAGTQLPTPGPDALPHPTPPTFGPPSTSNALSDVLQCPCPPISGPSTTHPQAVFTQVPSPHPKSDPPNL